MSVDFSALLGRGQNAAEQLFIWAVLQQLVAAMLSPAFQEVQRAVNEVSQTTPLSPLQLADMVVRNILARGDAEAYAKQSGIAPSDFQRMVESAGEPPSPQEMLAAVRRGVAPLEGTGPDQVSFQQAVAESRIYTKYTRVLEALADLPLTVGDAVDAAVENQIPYDQAQREAFLSGVNADRFRILVNTRGNPPSPTELNELHKRGLIPLEGTGPEATSVQQGIFEGATKDKWWKLLAALADYVPPPRTVTALVREGTVTDDQALKLFQEAGLPADLAGAYLASGHHQKTQAQRDLTVSQVTALYRDRLVSRDEATTMLGALRFDAGSIAFLLDLADFEALQVKVRSAVTKVHNLYVAHKIDQQTASTTLDGLGIPAAGRDEMLTVWNLERDANVATLTAAEIADAVFYAIIPIGEGVARLVELGWPQDEAIIRIGIRLHGKQPPPAPAQ